MPQYSYLLLREHTRVCEQELVGALVTLDVAGVTGYTAAFERFKKAVTEWVVESDEGRELWFTSANDLNIGDLLTYGVIDNEVFKIYMRKHGVTVKMAHSLTGDQRRSFDEQLVDGKEVVCDDCNGEVDVSEAHFEDAAWHCGCR